MFKKSLLALLLVPSMALAKANFPAGEGLSEYRQFLLFPYVDKAYKLMDKQDYAGAVENWHYALEVSPHNEVVSKELVTAYLALEQYQKAFHLVEERQAYFGEHSWYQIEINVLTKALAQQHGDLLPHAIALLDKPELNENEKSAVLSAVLDYHVAQNEMTQAFELRRRYLSIDSSNFTWHLSYAYALLNTGRLSAVATLLTEPAFAQSEAGIEIARELLNAYVARDDESNAIKWLKYLEAESELTVKDNLLWSNILLEQGDYDGAAGRLIPYKSNIEAQIQLAFIDMAVKDELGTARALRQIKKLMTNAEQERLLIRLASELAQSNARLARQAYGYQVRFIENETLWQNKVINIALAHQDYDVAEELLKQQTTSSGQQAKLLTIYLAQRQWSQALPVIQRQYQQASGSQKLVKLDTYSYVLLQLGKDKSAKTLLMAHYPFAGTTAQRQNQLLARLWSLEGELTSQDLTVLAAANQSLPASAKGQLSQLLAQRGDCQSAQAMMPSKPSRQQLMTLAYCYQKQSSPFAYDFFLAADNIKSDRASAAPLAYYDAKYGDLQAAYERWLGLSQRPLPAADYLAAAYTALTVVQGAQAQAWLDQYLALEGERSEPFLALQAQVHELNQQPEQALPIWRQLYQSHPKREYVLAIARLAEPNEAQAILEKSLIWLPQDTEVLSQLSLYAAKQEDYLQAADYLEQVVAQTPDNYPLFEQLAYYHYFAGQRQQAQQWLAQALDAKDYYLQHGEGYEQQLYHLKRFNTELQRRYALRIDYWAGDNAVPSHLVIGANDSTKKYSNYWNVELDWLDKKQVNAWGEWVWYGRLFGQAESNSHVFKPGGVSSISVGLRYKPLRNVNWNFFIEPMYRFDQDTADLMLRTTASLISNPKYSGDWHPGSDAYWLEQDLYLDASYLTHDESYALLAKYSVGPHFKLASSMARASSLRPYVMAQASTSDLGEDTRAGVGLSYHFFSGGSERMAYKQKSSVEVEYHHSFSTYLSGDEGVSLILRLAW